MESPLVLMIFEVVALAALSALCVYLITVIVRIRSILTFFEQDVRDLTSKAIPVFENLEIITDKVKAITENIDEQVEMVKHSILSIKDVADNIVEFERRAQERFEEPVMEKIGRASCRERV